jgi:hypothetical protein
MLQMFQVFKINNNYLSYLSIARGYNHINLLLCSCSFSLQPILRKRQRELLLSYSRLEHFCVTHGDDHDRWKLYLKCYGYTGNHETETVRRQALFATNPLIFKTFPVVMQLEVLQPSQRKPAIIP